MISVHKTGTPAWPLRRRVNDTGVFEAKAAAGRGLEGSRHHPWKSSGIGSLALPLNSLSIASQICSAW
jgi:hypothetical protein